MKKIFFFLIFVNLFVSLRSQGYLLDSNVKSSLPQFSQLRADMPDRASLLPYVPISFPQKGSTCMAHSFALARSIMFAKQNRLTDSNKITSLQMSPFFLYYLSRDKSDFSCSSGLSARQIIATVKKHGFAFMFDVEYPNYYPFTKVSLCPNSLDFYPPSLSEELKYASKFSVDEVYVTSSIDAIKYALSIGLPVVAGITAAPSFFELKSSLWAPRHFESKVKYPNSGHAVVLVSYDDFKFGGSFYLVNSWGYEWGENGSAWVKYEDLENWLDLAFIMEAGQGSINMDYPSKGRASTSKLKQISLKVNLRDSTQINFNNKRLINAFK